MKGKIIYALFLTLFSNFAYSNVRVAKIFGAGMVLQRNQPIPIWGWADKGESVTIQFHNQTKKVTAGADGKWKTVLSSENAGGPYILSVKGKNTLKMDDVLVGDVWICSGQSNMEWPLSASNNAKEEIAAANYPKIRHFKVQTDASGKLQSDLKFDGAWTAALPENVGRFTAVGYFFARDLYKELNVPIGLINTTWGGTDIEAWISRQAFENSDDFKETISKAGTIDLETESKVKTEAVKQLVKSLQGDLPAAVVLQNWPSISLNDSSWPVMNVPGLWEAQALKDLDGKVWLRKSFNISSEDAGKEALLALAMIDDNDETYLNGTKVGSTAGYNLKRSYTIPAGLLKSGKNVIAVRVDDLGGGGGVYGEPSAVSLSVGNKVVPLSGDWKFGVEAIQNSSTSINPNSFPSILYNAMIHPLIPYAMKGVIWYQGENNSSRAFEYRKAFPLMINDWRNKWRTNFPFYFVQLASYNASGGNSQASSWAELREAQAMTLSLPNTGMAVTTDIGDARDIHPRNKQDVGHRLAAVALHQTYGKHRVHSGPVYKSMKVEGNKVIISFSSIGSGLSAKDSSGNLSGFHIAGEDRQFKPANASIQNNTIVVYLDGVTNPLAVRYNWADFAAQGNLYNKEGFPAAPFRTDDWQGITVSNKYVVRK